MAVAPPPTFHYRGRRRWCRYRGFSSQSSAMTIEILLALYPLRRLLFDRLPLHDCVNLMVATHRYSDFGPLIARKLFFSHDDTTDDSLKTLFVADQQLRENRVLNDELLTVVRGLANKVHNYEKQAGRFASSHEYLSFVRAQLCLTVTRLDERGDRRRFGFGLLHGAPQLFFLYDRRAKRIIRPTDFETRHERLSQDIVTSLGLLSDSPAMLLLATFAVANNYLTLGSPWETCSYTRDSREKRSVALPRLLVRMLEWLSDAYVSALRHLCSEKLDMFHGCLVQTNEDLFEHAIGLEHRVCSLNTLPLSKIESLGLVTVCLKTRANRDTLVVDTLLENMVQRYMYERLLSLTECPANTAKRLTVTVHHGLSYRLNLTVRWDGEHAFRQTLRVRYAHCANSPRHCLPIYRNRKRLFLLADPHIALTSVSWKYHDFAPQPSRELFAWRRIVFLHQHSPLGSEFIAEFFHQLRQHAKHNLHNFYSHYVLLTGRPGVQEFASTQDRCSYEQLYLPVSLIDKRVACGDTANNDENPPIECEQTLVYTGERYIEVYRPLLGA